MLHLPFLFTHLQVAVPQKEPSARCQSAGREDLRHNPHGVYRAAVDEHRAVRWHQGSVARAPPQGVTVPSWA